MLIVATLSGIQDYVFDVQESGGGQSKALRARSFRVQIISEAIALRLVHALNIDPDKIILRAAAKFVIDAGVVDEPRRAAVATLLQDIQRWLLTNTHGQLRLAVAQSDAEGTEVARFADVHHWLARQKLMPWRGIADGPWNGLVLSELCDSKAEADKDKEIGRVLLQSQKVVFAESTSDSTPIAGNAVEAAGLCVTLDSGTSASVGSVLATENANRFAFHVPTDDHGDPVEFVELASRSRGAAMLGILKADVDSLGHAVKKRLDGVARLQPLHTLSNQLNAFFGPTIEHEIRRGDTRWRNLYTVFAGGDDLLLVGPWDVALDFAGHLHRLFRERLGGKEGLTLSAGVAIIKPKYPIRRAAEQVETLLEQAKQEIAQRAISPKDQCAALGGLWKWQDHDTILAAGKRLADWVDTDVIQRGWLHTLLQLALLRRGQAGLEFAGTHPAMATSRLAWHVSRNWPRAASDNVSKRSARLWGDAILREFDQFDTTGHVETIHLPAIIRYAMLATRAGERNTQS